MPYIPYELLKERPDSIRGGNANLAEDRTEVKGKSKKEVKGKSRTEQ